MRVTSHRTRTSPGSGVLDAYLRELAGMSRGGRPDVGEMIGLLDRSATRLNGMQKATLAKALRAALGGRTPPAPLAQALVEFKAAPAARRASVETILQEVAGAGTDPAAMLRALHRADEGLESLADRATVAHAARSAFAGRDLPLAVKAAIGQVLSRSGDAFEG